MAQKTITIEGTEYNVATIKTGEAKALRGKFDDPISFHIALVAASLRAGGHPEATEDFVNDLPYFQVYVQLVGAAQAVNGLVAAPGEATAAPETAAASTSDTSTAQ